MNLSEYITEIGVKAFAKKTGITERTALSYKYGLRLPRPVVARKIIRHTPVTLAGIYGAESLRKKSSSSNSSATNPA